MRWPASGQAAWRAPSEGQRPCCVRRPCHAEGDQGLRKLRASERNAAGRQAGHGVGAGRGPPTGFPLPSAACQWAAHQLAQGMAVLRATNPAAGEVSADIPALSLVAGLYVLSADCTFDRPAP